MNDIDFGYHAGRITKAFEQEGYYVWDCSVIKADGEYHMFSSHWKRELGFNESWLFYSEIIHSVSKNPEGPYVFRNVVLPPRGPQYFDGRNTHNTCIKEFNGKFYLYYMGATYGGDIAYSRSQNSQMTYETVWNKKRIGVAVADDINGEFVRRDKPLLEPRDCSHWDCTITTNPSVAILPSGKTYMIYKSRTAFGYPVQLGIAVADAPDGEFRRLTENPILDFGDKGCGMEDPFLWYDAKKQRLCMIAKDDPHNGSRGFTGEWGSGFYAESENGVDFVLGAHPKVYSKNTEWSDGRKVALANMERPSVLFDENGKPTHIFFAGGDGKIPYIFDGGTYIMCAPLIPND